MASMRWASSASLTPGGELGGDDLDLFDRSRPISYFSPG
jgi:hypothetical protein